MIAGYNTMANEEKEKIDLKKLYGYMAVLMFLNAACLFALAKAIFFENTVMHRISLFALIAVNIIIIIFMNTKNRLSSD